MIEDIILQYSGQRNIHKLRKYLPQNFCEQAADAILAHPGKVLITTGFWVAGTCETDGPVGAIVLADVINELGSEPVFVTECASLRPFILFQLDRTGSCASLYFNRHLLTVRSLGVQVKAAPIVEASRACQGGL